MDRVRVQSRVLLSVVILTMLISYHQRVVAQASVDDLIDPPRPTLKVITVATDATCGYRDFIRSCSVYNINVTVLGMGDTWKGGDISNIPGGGQKVLLLKNELERLRRDNINTDEMLIMFVDSYDVIMTSTADEIVDKFLALQSRIVFGAEHFCWPDKSLSVKYPTVRQGKRYLNSGGFIGYMSDVYELIRYRDIKESDDDQLFYTKLYLDEDIRNKHKITLDTTSSIFHNLNGATDELKLRFEGANSLAHNTLYNTVPSVIHGNGPSPTKLHLRYLSNYLANKWTPDIGCTDCINVLSNTLEHYPNILLAIFIEHPTPFVQLFLKHLTMLNYPKDKVDVFIHNSVMMHNKEVEMFIQQHQGGYKSIELFTDTETNPATEEHTARNTAFLRCLKSDQCSYLFVVDSVAQITNPDTLLVLQQQQKPFVAPMLTRYKKFWSNFWGALDSDGFYDRSEDYLSIVDLSRRGLWDEPFVTHVYLIDKTLMNRMKPDPYTTGGGLDADMSLCKSIRDINECMLISNQFDYGHLTDPTNYETTHFHNDMYEIFNNPLTWHIQYIHPHYKRNLDKDVVDIDMPCPDVYMFPMFTEKYCNELIGEMENFGQWSSGTSDDKRLSGGYENVPTVDIHLNQIGLEKQWLHFLKLYVAPVQQKLFPGYFTRSQAVLNFVVRYHPDEQYFLKPHHDSSTFTLNIALNKHGVDFIGGGARFIRYNCSVIDTEPGYSLIHPGRLTHLHEGLPITNGTRYIMVSFVDP